MTWAGPAGACGDLWGWPPAAWVRTCHQPERMLAGFRKETHLKPRSWFVLRREVMAADDQVFYCTGIFCSSLLLKGGASSSSRRTLLSVSWNYVSAALRLGYSPLLEGLPRPHLTQPSSCTAQRRPMYEETLPCDYDRLSVVIYLNPRIFTYTKF